MEDARVPEAVAIHVVDAFADRPFTGNPAAVCLPNEMPGEDWLASVAAEMNLSETAFVVRAAGGWDLRWFTPRVEVDLCGHATLASAHVLWESGRLGREAAAVFRTRRSGILTCRREGDWIAMDFPASPPERVPVPPGLLEALGCREARWVGRSAFDYFVELGDASAVRELTPEFRRLASFPVRGVIVTARGGEGWDFVSRFFAPSVGVDEDPVTGSAHCALGPFWSGRLGRGELRGWQASRRGGEVRVRMQGERLDLLGRAVTVTRGELLAVGREGRSR